MLPKNQKCVQRNTKKGEGRKVNEWGIEVTLRKIIEPAHDMIETFSSVTEKIASKSRIVETKNSLES